MGAFSPPVTVTSSPCFGVSAGDFDEDGFADLVAGSALAVPALRVFFGGPAGLGATPATFSAGSGGTHVTVADMNGDAHSDVVLGGNQLNVWLGDGGGQLALASTTSPVFLSNQAVADFDHEGALDLLTREGSAPDVLQFRHGDNQGGLAAPASLQTWAGSFRAQDLDGDGKPDLVGRHAAKWLAARIDLASGPAQFASPLYVPFATNLGDVNAVDLDGDSDLDLVASVAAGLGIVRGIGGVQFEANRMLPDVYIVAAVPGDADGDGFDDLVELGGSGNIQTRLGDGAGGFGPPIPSPAIGSVAADLALADVDLDGDLDAAAGTSSGSSLLLGDGQGGFAPAQTSHFTANVRVGFGDADLDGLPDLALFSSVVAFGWFEDVYVLFGAAGGTFGATAHPICALTMLPGTHLEFADLTGDGASDVLATLADQGQLAISNGAGGFSAPQTIGVGGAKLKAARGGDVDGDGDADLVLADGATNGGLRIFLASAGVFTPGSFVALGAKDHTPFDLLLADADGDGRDDALLLAKVTEAGLDSSVAIFRGDGLGSFGTPTSFATSVDGSVTILHAFDAEHDGRIDLVTAAKGAGLVAILDNRLPDFFTLFGAGCPGSGGFVPRVRLSGVAVPGATAALALENGLGGSAALLLGGSGTGNLPLPGGCTLLVAPIVNALFPLTLSGSGAGMGTFTLSGVVPPALPPGSQLAFQALVVDPGVPAGFSATNGMLLSVQ